MLRLLKKWIWGDEASAALEAGFLFPIMTSILLGVVDVGRGLTVNQKVTNSCHVIADLLTREDEVTDAEFNDAVIGGQLVLMPYSTEPMGYDVAGIQFIGATKVPTVEWRDTVNMDPNPDVTSDSEGLGDQNEGVVAVTVKYHYAPFFTGFAIGEIFMQEVSYARGRKGVFVTRTDS
jgi:Flp pilus assembly protein TadG